MLFRSYDSYEFQLEPGDKIFIYTDGVPEASNIDKQMFTLERLLTALNQDEEASPKTILENVKTSVEAFTKEAEQFDDMTMLCLEYKGKQNN